MIWGLFSVAAGERMCKVAFYSFYYPTPVSVHLFLSPPPCCVAGPLIFSIPNRGAFLHLLATSFSPLFSAFASLVQLSPRAGVRIKLSEVHLYFFLLHSPCPQLFFSYFFFLPSTSRFDYPGKAGKHSPLAFPVTQCLPHLVDRSHSIGERVKDY